MECVWMIRKIFLLFCLFLLSGSTRIEEISNDFPSDTLAFFMNDQPVNQIPTDHSYQVNVVCRSATGIWDYDNWSLRIRNLTTTREKCNLFFSQIYEITYDLGGGRFPVSANPSEQYVYGVGASLPTAEEVFKLNHSLVGWYDNPEFTGEAITEISASQTGNIKLYAKWIRNYSTIDYQKTIIATDPAYVNYQNGSWIFTAYQANNRLNMAKIQIYKSSLSEFLDQIVSCFQTGFSVYYYQSAFEGEHKIYFGANGSTKDPKSGFVISLEKGRQYRFSFDMVEMSDSRIIWNDFNVEIRDL